jgi:hypothetical protein
MKQAACKANPEDGGHVPPKRRWTFNGLHGVISQKIVLFMAIAMITSSRTSVDLFNVAASKSDIQRQKTG